MSSTTDKPPASSLHDTSEDPSNRLAEQELTHPQPITQSETINNALQVLDSLVSGEVKERLLAGLYNRYVAENKRLHLHALPKEIRAIIFEMAVTMKHTEWVEVEYTFVPPGLLTASQLMREESIGHYFQNNSFKIIMRSNSSDERLETIHAQLSRLILEPCAKKRRYLIDVVYKRSPPRRL
ncbi:hypothetical protein LTR56_005400 [Elasticomyces elasticus]|nr:hypothetical protein LTR22_020631 [Elasticomyces elasticus]KAK3651892.1 hypothetical protein LTR56_005400 [Elasticomyces elasticus]KAK4927787.1 hypothetical protein LTR49_005412 [Elasticomyces elasticus]KAK5761458.1 hypothetical protein LTS12_008420 [Elasticomyces elasticus]